MFLDDGQLEAAAEELCHLEMLHNHGKRCLHISGEPDCPCNHWQRARDFAERIVRAYLAGERSGGFDP